MTAVRLLLVLAVLLGQLPCGSVARAAAAAEPVPPPAAVKRCPCCKRDKAGPAQAPTPKPLPVKPTCPPDCPCAVCSPGYVPLTADAGPPQLVEPAGDFLPELVPSTTQIGHRPPLDRPPRAAD
jgi:hypothetical protein